ncbi:MAG: hypothetical protein TREMPRED_005420 [Tremellales sp. Tagirdzhanova-0007]|nr:MAG: hypothetical protein TREMPRED_005420 [Tremellales sp. Tagirdzhanova-0007]
MDGTLLGSTPAVLATWEFYAREYSLDLTEVLKTSHGVRTIDNLRRWCGLTDQAALEEATNAFEMMIISEAQRLQSEGKSGLQILPGVSELLNTLDAAPTSIWAIVTSATPLYASAALSTAGIQDPPRLITAADVINGKPNPEPYMVGAKALDMDPEKCIVVEDAPSGIKAGVAAGCRVLAVCTSHERTQLEGLGATWIVEDLSKVTASVEGDMIRLAIDETGLEKPVTSIGS